MVSGIQHHSHYMGRPSPIMASHEETSPTSAGDPSSKQVAFVPYQVPPSHLPTEHFSDSLPPSEYPVSAGPVTAQKKVSSLPLFLQISSPRQESARHGPVAKCPVLSSGIAAESTSQSSFELQIQLLEQALGRTDANLNVGSNSNAHTRPEKRGPASSFDHDFFFSDILGENEITSAEFSTMTKTEEIIQDASRTPAFSGSVMATNEDVTRSCDFRGIGTAGIDSDFTGAFGNLVGSDISTDFHCPDPNGSTDPGNEITATSIVSRVGISSELHNAKIPLRKELMGDRAAFIGGHPNLVNRVGPGRIRKPWSISRGTKTKVPALLGAKANSLMSMTDGNNEVQDMVQSPISDSSMISLEIGSHPDLYANLSVEIRNKVDRLQAKISAMPRRKLRESLAKGVTIDDVEPLMCVNRDELAGMLGLGVTTWKMFVHHTLGIPRWPARALKSQQVKEKKLMQKKLEAEQRGEFEMALRVQKELDRLIQAHIRQRKHFRSEAKLRMSRAPIQKQSGFKGTPDRV